jgi:hypothetical protein
MIAPLINPKQIQNHRSDNRARSAANRYSPKSFASAWRNCPAHVEESAQWRAGFQTWEIKTGAIMTIAGYLAATALIALIVWAYWGCSCRKAKWRKLALLWS